MDHLQVGRAVVTAHARVREPCINPHHNDTNELTTRQHPCIFYPLVRIESIPVDNVHCILCANCAQLWIAYNRFHCNRCVESNNVLHNQTISRATILLIYTNTMHFVRRHLKTNLSLKQGRKWQNQNTNHTSPIQFHFGGVQLIGLMLNSVQMCSFQCCITNIHGNTSKTTEMQLPYITTLERSKTKNQINKYCCLYLYIYLIRPTNLIA